MVQDTPDAPEQQLRRIKRIIASANRLGRIEAAKATGAALEPGDARWLRSRLQRIRRNQTA